MECAVLKCQLHGAAAASAAVKKAWLAELKWSCEATVSPALVPVPPPPLSALLGVFIQGSFPGHESPVSSRPCPAPVSALAEYQSSENGLCVKVFHMLASEDSGEGSSQQCLLYLSERGLISRLAASRSSICRTPLLAALKFLWDSFELRTQKSVTSVSSSVDARMNVALKESSVWLLVSIFYCLHCAKQLKTEDIFYSHSELTQCCFHCVKNNDSCLSIYSLSETMLQWYW